MELCQNMGIFSNRATKHRTEMKKIRCRITSLGVLFPLGIVLVGLLMYSQRKEEKKQNFLLIFPSLSYFYSNLFPCIYQGGSQFKFGISRPEAF